MDVEEVLRSEGYRVTSARKAVWTVLHATPHHLTAEQIHDRVRELEPDVNLASVYRTLALLAELDLAHEVAIGDGAGRWELAHADEQVHLVCRGCGSIEHHPADGLALEQLFGHLAGNHEFVPDGVDMIVHGRCGTCADG